MTKINQQYPTGYDYNKNIQPDISVKLSPQVQWLHKEGNLHPACYDCIRRKLTDCEGPLSEITGKPIYQRGEFIISCHGIPLDYTKLLPKTTWNGLSTKQQEEFVCSQDPVYWAWKYLNWYPRVAKNGVEYQAIIMRCTSDRIMARWGRRMGKSEALAARILWHAFYHTATLKVGKEAAAAGEITGDILVVAPYGYQVANMFSKMRKMITQGAPEIQNFITRDVKNPHELELSNGTKIKGRSSSERSGSKGEAIRSEGADLIIYDEMDYLDNETISTVNAVLTGSEKHQMIGASTPRGSRDTEYYKWCNSPIASEFWYPSIIAPHWTVKTDIEYRTTYPWMVFQREYLAEWGEQEAGVFPQEFIEKAYLNQLYRYGAGTDGIGYKANWVYTMGVDWNHRTGTQIVVCGLDPETRNVYVVDRAEVDQMLYKQINSVLKIRDLARIWKPEWIYIDRGFGETQYEHLHLIGQQARDRYISARSKEAMQNDALDARLVSIVKAINFSENTMIFDPLEGTEKKVQTKQALVQNCMRRFEGESIKFPETDNILRLQLGAYIEERVTPSGLSVYASREPDRIGDHIIDALFLALWAYTKEMGVLGKPHYSIEMAYTKQTLFNGAIEQAGRENPVISSRVPGLKTKEAIVGNNYSRFGLPDSRGIEDKSLPPDVEYSLGSLADKLKQKINHPSLRKRKESPKIDKDLSLIKDFSGFNGPSWRPQSTKKNPLDRSI